MVVLKEHDLQFIPFSQRCLPDIQYIPLILKLMGYHKEIFPAKIIKVRSAWPYFGSYYWHVETNLGDRSFVVRDPHMNVIRTTEDNIMLVDTMGNRFEIESLESLDAKSRAAVERAV